MHSKIPKNTNYVCRVNTTDVLAAIEELVCPRRWLDRQVGWFLDRQCGFTNEILFDAIATSMISQLSSCHSELHQPAADLAADR